MIMIIMIMILMRIIKTDSTANNYDDFDKIIAIMYDSDIVDVKCSFELFWSTSRCRCRYSIIFLIFTTRRFLSKHKMEVSAANYFLVSFEPYVEAVKQFCRFLVPIIDDWPLWSLCVIMIKMTLILKLMIILFPGRGEENWIIMYERRRKKLRLHCLWLSSVIEINFKISKLVVMRSKYFILIFTLYSFHHSHDEHNLSLLVFNILP